MKTDVSDAAGTTLSYGNVSLTAGLMIKTGGRDFAPEKVLTERVPRELNASPPESLTFTKDGHSFELFREYTDCLYAAYAIKWNGNAAAYNGSLFVVQDGRIRRLSPLECERLMGFPDDYTNIPGAKRTNRYQAVGNSRAVPVVRWIGERLTEPQAKQEKQTRSLSLRDVVSPDAPEEVYISPVGCQGILRRRKERNIYINPRLEEVLSEIAGRMPAEEIEKKSLVQRRGRYAFA